MATNKLAVIINGKEHVSKEALKAENSLKQLGGTTKQVSDAMGTAFLAASATIIAGTTALIASAVSAAKTTARIDDMSQKLGLSAKSFQEWEYVMSQSGMSIDSLQTSMKTLSGAADDAMNGNVKYANSFKTLGVSVTTADGKLKSQDLLLEETILALSAMTNETERTVLASDLLGKAAMELGPLFNSGAEGITEMKNRANELGIVLSDKTIQAGIKLDDTIDRLKRTMSATLVNAMTPLMGELSSIGEKFLSMSTGDGPIAKFAGILVRSVAWAVDKVPYIASAFGFVGDAISITYDEIKTFFDKAKTGSEELFDSMFLNSTVGNAIQITMRMGGDLFNAIKKGLSSGDWGDFWTAAGISLKFGISILASFQLASLAGTHLWSLIQSGLKAAGFALPTLGAGGAIAALSVAVSLAQAIEGGDYEKFGADLVGALAIGIGIGAFTGSPKAGTLSFTIAMNLGIGSKSYETVKNGMQNILSAIVPEDKQSLWASADTEIGPSDTLWEKLRKKSVSMMQNSMGIAGVAGGEKLSTALVEYDAEPATKVMGENVVAGFIKGIDNTLLIDKTSQMWINLQKQWNDQWGIHSPSTVAEDMGTYIVEGFAIGVNDGSWWSRIMQAWKNRMDGLKESTEIGVDDAIDGIVNGGSAPATPSSGLGEKMVVQAVDLYTDSGLADVFSNLLPSLSSFAEGLIPAIGALGAVNSILNPLTTIFGAMMETLGPIITDVLAPLNGILKVVGVLLGNVLGGAVRMLTPIIELVGQGFVWLYNNVLRHIGNGLIIIFNSISWAVAHLVNGISSAIKFITFGLVDLGKVAIPDIMGGMMQAIDLGTLYEQGGATGTSYTGGGTGSSTSVQSVNITIYQQFDGPVIGDGGLEAVGEFMVRAIRAYAGVGGNVTILGVA